MVEPSDFRSERSQPEEDESSLDAGTPDGPPRGGGAEGAEASPSQAIEEVYFPQDVARFLSELSRALQKHTMYPPAHPALRPAISRAYKALRSVLGDRAQLVLGIGRRRIAVGDAETDPGNPLLGGLADHLHSQDLASVTFRTGISERELSEFLARVALDPRRTDRPLGRALQEDARAWRHLLLKPVRYEGLGLAWSRAGRPPEGDRRRADELWLTLASSLLPAVGVPGTGAGTAGARGATEEGAVPPTESAKGAPVEDASEERRPEELAEALASGVSDEAFARSAFTGLAEVSREMRTLGGEPGRELQRRASRFIARADPEALGRVLASAGEGERHDLLRDAARWMEPTAVVKLIRTTGAIEGRDLSNPLLLLMAKMARYASSEAPDLAPEAEATLRDQVERLLTDWKREYEVPEPYRDALRQMAFSEPERVEVRESTHGAEPEHVLRLGMLVNTAGPHVWNSATSLMQRRRFRELVEGIGIAPPDSVAAEELWEELATPKAVAWILTPHPAEEDGPDLEALDGFVERLGAAAAPPMLDRMGTSESAELRQALFARLERLGPAIASSLIERLEDGRWWVRRNSLALLRRTGGWPATWTPHRLVNDPRPEVRTEALALLLRFRDQRDRAICDLLAEPAPRAVRLGLQAAQEAAPPEAVPLLLEVLEDETAEEEHRVLALRALGAARPPELPEPLVHAAATRRGGFFRLLGPFRPVKLRPRSRLVLEALAFLARGWKSHPDAMAVLRKARKSNDELVRAAAYGKLLGAVGPAGPEAAGPYTAGVEGTGDGTGAVGPGPEEAAGAGGAGGPARPPGPPEHVPGPEDAREGGP